MQTVTDRFFEAFEALLAMGATNVASFCKELGVDRRNFLKQREDHGRNILKPSWLTIIVERYKVAPRWLLTGRGQMFSK